MTHPYALRFVRRYVAEAYPHHRVAGVRSVHLLGDWYSEGEDLPFTADVLLALERLGCTMVGLHLTAPGLPDGDEYPDYSLKELREAVQVLAVTAPFVVDSTEQGPVLLTRAQYRALTGLRSEAPDLVVEGLTRQGEVLVTFRSHEWLYRYAITPKAGTRLVDTTPVEVG